jgi:hypothetical protein
MRKQFAIAAIVAGAATGFAPDSAVAQQNRGAVTAVAAQPGNGIGTFNFTIRGKNPCGAVRLDPGEGVPVTHAIHALPTTLAYEYGTVGTFTVRAEGMGNCDGVTTTQVTVTRVRPRPTPTPSPTPEPTPEPAAIRFPGMDRNGDKVITRAEWRGSVRSFELHDWNHDGVLSGDEVRVGAARPRGNARGRQVADFIDWTDAGFNTLDRNRDGRVVRGEWPYRLEEFLRIDRNRDNQIEIGEFRLGDIDDDREDRFEYLDLNNDGRLTRNEWHGSLDTFRWLDRNGDGVLHRTEVVGADLPGAVDTTGRNTVVPARALTVSARTAWTDTGINVRVGDLIVVSASGEIQVTPDSRDVAGPNGASGKPATKFAPKPDAEIGALVARIGNSPAFFVGASTDGLRAERAGRLYLGPNDDVLNDNRGQFRVTLSILR